MSSRTDGSRSQPTSTGLRRLAAGAGEASARPPAFVPPTAATWRRVPRLLFESVVPTSDGLFALTYSHTGCPAACDVVCVSAA